MLKSFTFITGVLYPFRDYPKLAGIPIGDFFLIMLLPMLFVCSRGVKIKLNMNWFIVSMLCFAYPLFSGLAFLMSNSTIFADDLMRFYIGFFTFSYLVLAESHGIKAIKYILSGMCVGVFAGIFTDIVLLSALQQYVNSIKFSSLFFSEYNFSASLYLLCFCFNIASLLESNQKSITKLAHAVSSCVMASLIIASYSRANFVGLVLSSVIFFVVVFFGSNSHIKIGTKLLSVVFILAATAFALVKYWDKILVNLSRFENIINPYEDGTRDSRFDILLNYIDYILQYPLGFGIGNIRLLSDSGISEHNTILQIISIYGVFGLFLIFFMIYLAVKNFKLSIKSNDYFPAILSFAMLLPTVAYNLLVVRHFWVVLAIVLLCGRYNFQGKQNESEKERNNNL